MAQANKYVPKTQFAADVRANKPGREAVSAGGLDAEFRHIRFSINALCENLALIQRDDGQLQDAAVDVHTLHRDVLMLLGKYELFGTWVPNRPYLQGYVVDYEGKLYVCTESHDANAAMDLSKFKAFGTASGSLKGDYLPVKWDESFFNADADSLTEAGVYVLKEGATGFLLVLGVAPNLGQVRVRGEGIGVRFQSASGWTDWIDFGQDDGDGALKIVNNLSDLKDKALSRVNLEVPVFQKITTGVDFNNLTETGVYSIGGTTNKNQPSASFGKLEVVNNGVTGTQARIYQEFTNEQIPPKVYNRALHGTSWADWIEVPTIQWIEVPKIQDATETTAGKAKIATTAIAQAGINDADIMTPLKTLGLFNLKSLGVEQSPQSFTVSSRVGGTSYLNSTGKPITVYLTGANSEEDLQISKDGTTWFTVGKLGKNNVYTASACAVVPTGFYYKLASGTYSIWTEVR